MKLKLVLSVILAAVLLGVSACQVITKATLEVTCDQFAKGPSVISNFDIPLGRTIQVTLCSNPSTGFRWPEKAQISDPSVLEQTEHQFTPPQEQVPGAAGKEVWIFKAKKEGTANISLESTRPGQSQVQWSFAATITVK